MGSLDLQEWMRIGAMNRLAEVGRVPPCAPYFARQESVIAVVGAQRTARPTLRFMERIARENILLVLNDEMPLHQGYA